MKFTLISSESLAYTLLTKHRLQSWIHEKNRQNCVYNIRSYKIHSRHCSSVIDSNRCLCFVTTTCATSGALRVSCCMLIRANVASCIISFSESGMPCVAHI